MFWTAALLLTGLVLFVACLCECSWHPLGSAHFIGRIGSAIIYTLAVIVLGPLLLWLSYGFAEYFIISWAESDWDGIFYIDGEKPIVDYASLRLILLSGFMLIAVVVVHAAGGIARDYLNRAHKSND